MAKRVVRTVTGAERVKRSRAVAAVIHSGRLEGFKDNPEWIRQMDRFAKGEISREELRAVAHRR
ncbi:antitoxin VbhA family protein [Curtobacterium sp. MCPF17_002]|uniref:antitoxin VbhA family protein n=1 Tax=Curtobacterium sp. MCPF17_002 TaxID=2175645 RepID=UPI0015E8C2B2|nr:antitoxin VbhA family protein [Curtobacterium sp. MCPF17_002]WIB78809.1 antitoxin VbhA family protein [Curtobacterium sp. MCPF17_002]